MSRRNENVSEEHLCKADHEKKQGRFRLTRKRPCMRFKKRMRFYFMTTMRRESDLPSASRR